MLYSLGPIEFRLAPLNPQRTRTASRYPFVSHDVLGAAPIYEDMGDGEKRFSISCVTFPNNDLFADGLSVVGALETARAAGVSLLLMRGDGTLLGYYLIVGVQEMGETLDWVGVPGELQIEIELLRADPPFADAIFNLFGGIL